MIQLLFLALLIPLVTAALQMVVPSVLPDIIAPKANTFGSNVAVASSRIRGTFGHSNAFTTTLLLFMGLSVWQLEQSKQQNRWLWIGLLMILAFFFVSTKALFGLMMLGTFVIILLIPRLNPVNLIAGILFLLLVVGMFASSDFGQERLSSLTGTPLLNPDIDIWKAIILSKGDGNSFNWRIAQWTYLIEQWKEFPLLGFGLGLSIHVSENNLLPHNDYIRALVEGGFIGLVSFLSFFGLQAMRISQLLKSRNKSQRDLSLVMFAFFVAVPVGMITENIWGHTTLFFYWWTLMAISSWNWQEESSSQESTIDWYRPHNFGSHN